MGSDSKELLGIEPLELCFPFETKKQISCSMQLTNRTDGYIAFKVKTTSPKKYCVRPNSGIVPPRSTSDVIVGLDCIFNMGAMLFFLMADACGRPENNSFDLTRKIPTTYRLWNLVASVIGFAAPLALLFASSRGTLQPQLAFIPFLVLLGPYLLLLSVQMLTEMLTWHWKSPVWLVAPVVYEGYRVLQLMRGLQLANEITAPGWMVQSLRGLVSWWVLVLGIQLMRVAWFAGLNFASRPSYGSSDDTNK